jgi:hypothetical protein
MITSLKIFLGYIINNLANNISPFFQIRRSQPLNHRYHQILIILTNRCTLHRLTQLVKLFNNYSDTVEIDEVIVKLTSHQFRRAILTHI